MEILPDKRSVLFTVQGYSAHLSQRCKIIYSLVLFSFSSFLIAMPWIRVPVNTSVRGMVRSEQSRATVKVLATAPVLRSGVEHNRFVYKGDTLLVQDPGNRWPLVRELEIRLSDYQLNLADLDVLLSHKDASVKNLKTVIYQNSLENYLLNFHELRQQYLAVKQKLLRFTPLAEKGVISDHDYQNHLNELRKRRFEYVQFRSQQREIWIQERFTWQQEIDRIQAEIESMKGELKDLVILSPLTGHLLSSQLSQPGTVLYNGSLLAEISPDTSRLVECFINSSLIGFLKENARVRFSIDAYNHNLWGMADGRIRDIGKDVELIDKYPYYRVLCSLDTEFLQLKNGVKGQIKKGMSLSAHFLLAERSLYDLLFDSMDDWLDPSNL